MPEYISVPMPTCGGERVILRLPLSFLDLSDISDINWVWYPHEMDAYPSHARFTGDNTSLRIRLGLKSAVRLPTESHICTWDFTQ
jgi:hypothetical protein